MLGTGAITVCFFAASQCPRSYTLNMERLWGGCQPHAHTGFVVLSQLNCAQGTTTTTDGTHACLHNFCVDGAHTRHFQCTLKRTKRVHVKAMNQGCRSPVSGCVCSRTLLQMTLNGDEAVTAFGREVDHKNQHLLSTDLCWDEPQE